MFVCNGNGDRARPNLIGTPCEFGIGECIEVGNDRWGHLEDQFVLAFVLVLSSSLH